MSVPLLTGVFAVLTLFTNRASKVETYVPYNVPNLSSADAKLARLNLGQMLTDNGIFGFGFTETENQTSRMFVKDLESGRDAWAVTLPAAIDHVRVADGILLAADTQGNVIWSTPAPSGPNAGPPYYARVLDTGSLVLLDSNNSVLFRTPPPAAAAVQATETAHPAQTAVAQTAVPIVDTTSASGPQFMKPAGPYGLPAIFAVPE